MAALHASVPPFPPNNSVQCTAGLVSERFQMST